MTPGATHKCLFYSEMAKLLEAGLDIRKAASLLRGTRLPPAQAALLKDLDLGLEAGETIASAFGRDTRNVSDLERSIIAAGERGGRLAPAFQHLADYFAMLASARREIITGMIYPLVILHLGIVIAVVPTALMLGTLTVGQILIKFILTLLATYAAAVAIFLTLRTVLRAALTHARVDRRINRIPWIGNARRNFVMARFCKVYHSCLLASIPMWETVSLAAVASHSGAIREASCRLVVSASEGDALGPGFLAEDAFPKPFARSYATGEEAGTLDTDLARWSKIFQDEAASGARLVSVMLPKLLYFLIMLFVAWKIISFFNGYYSGMLEMIEE